ncbi:DNA-directed RNA polymerase subunit K [Methanocaldococcus sp.]
MKLTKFEIARMIGARSLQIAEGAYSTIDIEELSSLKIAFEEFKRGKLPLKPIRER